MWGCQSSDVLSASPVSGAEGRQFYHRLVFYLLISVIVEVPSVLHPLLLCEHDLCLTAHSGTIRKVGIQASLGAW